MKKKCTKLVYNIFLLTVKGFIIQCLFLTIVVAGSMGGSNAQSLYEVNIDLKLKNTTLKEAIAEISDKTNYIFAFNIVEMRKKQNRVTRNFSDKSVGYILEFLARSYNLNFKRINETIHIRESPSRKERQESGNEISIVVKEISGKVTDEEGNGLPGVNVLVKGTDVGVITDVEGNYKLNAPEDATILIFSYVGYVTEEVEIGSRAVINFRLTPDIETLSEVVVVGYGTQKKANLTGAVATVTAKDIDSRPITSLATALQGMTSGVFVNQNSGQPGRDNVLIRIRGVGTLNNANPLILVDGIEAPFNNINPSDIESITVLKDAASSAIYGSRAANGVVLVTTKRGDTNSKPSFTYDGYVGTSEAVRLPEMVNDAVLFAQLRNEASTNFGNSPIYSDAQIAAFRDRASEINTNWIDELFNAAPIQQHNFGIAGGSGKTNFRISLGYLDQEGTVPNSEFKRYNARLNLDTKINDQVKIGTSISLVRGDRNSQLDDLGNLGSGITRALQAHPTYPVLDAQGRWAVADPAFSGVARGNPLALSEAATFRGLSNDFLGNAYIEYMPVSGLTIKGTVAANYRITNNSTFNKSVSVYNWNTGEEMVLNAVRSASESNNQSLNITTWLTATYDKSFGGHNFQALVGYNQEESNSSNFRAFRNGHLSNAVTSLDVGVASSSTNGGNKTTWGLRSYFARISYNFENRYLFEANVRIDGSSRFLNDKWGTFPSFSAGWVVSQEDFMQNISAIDFLKIRASWGQLGNQNIGNFAFAKQLSLSQAYNFGGSVVPGVAQTTLGNADLSWETSTMTNVGIDLGLFNNLTLEADYFIKTTSDILLNVPISVLSGFNTQIANASEVENKGWELGLNFDRQFGDLSLSVGGNVTHVTTEVTELNPNIDVGEIDRFISGRRITEQGSPINAFYGLKAIGIFQSQSELDNAPDHSQLHGQFGPGDLRFEDVNNDGVINADDRVIIGKEDPTWTYGFNIRLGYKGFDLSAIFQGAADFNSYAGEELADPFFNIAGLHSRWTDRWTPENTGASMPRLYFSTGPSNSMANSFFVFDRSYLRFKNLQIGYSLPQEILDNIFLEKVRVYVNGSNLFTITDFPYFDPERPSGADRGGQGFPNLRVFSGGVSLTF
ncbi:TonB-dependent receptor [Fulvivirgaceae bacterium BMA10]|uniref:TonB-dependent receptor n=1 Tax=Splendidivirga corallicola TaxID=3051826 RepID=A0ABT8KN35_9BACT|nr:TonB-dependent receptor [Fulvivirgaceae bacterium BMA10]